MAHQQTREQDTVIEYSTCNIMPLLPEHIQGLSRDDVIRVEYGGVELIVQPAVFDRTAHIHTPVQVQDDLEYCWENTRPARSSNGQVESTVFVLHDHRYGRRERPLPGFGVVDCRIMSQINWGTDMQLTWRRKEAEAIRRSGSGEVVHLVGVAMNAMHGCAWIERTSSLRMIPVTGSSTCEPKTRFTVDVTATAIPCSSKMDEWL